MKTKTASVRRTREQWRHLLAQWRRSGESGGEFARKLGVLETTLRWWAWRLDGQGKQVPGEPPVTLVPVRVTGEDEDDRSGHDAEGRSAPLAWTLRTARGELRVYGGDRDLVAVVAALVGRSR
jgi:hypothetical protein